MESVKGLFSKSAAIILCGGKGTRMGSSTLHKVCFPIQGVPAVNRTISMLKSVGFNKIVVIVGAMAQNVIETVGKEFPDIVFAYQSQQLGTGHAAQVGLNVLNMMGFTGPILITPGDKLIEPEVISAMGEVFLRQKADMVFVTGPKKQNPDSGRIVIDRKTGKILGNVEVRDIQLAKVLGELKRKFKTAKRSYLTFEQFLKIGRRYIPREDKLIKSTGKLAEILKTKGKIDVYEFGRLVPESAEYVKLADKLFTPDEIERNSPTVNLSVYLGTSNFWTEILPSLQADNAQGEYYLTDVITIGSSANYRLVQYEIPDPAKVMGFNSPDELLKIEDTLRRKRQKSKRVADLQIVKLPHSSFKEAGKWLELFETWPNSLHRLFTRIYGPDESLIENRRALFVKVIKHFIKRYGADKKVVIVRAPGRINLMGRHIDHRGGAVNVMAIDRDVIFVAAPRNDDRVLLSNVDPKTFPDREFSIAELLGQIEWQDWISFINSDYVRRILAQTKGDWSNYVKASLLRLQERFKDIRILGFSAAVVGDIPIAAGLSSSSALVVASAEIAVRFNNLNVTPNELVDICGEGEWFVGSRGGSADHAAISMGKRGQVAHVKFAPFEVARIYNFPEHYRLIIANSGIDAYKSASAKDKFNQKVASYELGFMILKNRHEEYAHLLEHLRDVNPRRLNCPISKIYELLRSVPEELLTSSLWEVLPVQFHDRVNRVLSSHKPPNKYELRGVLLYGIAECERSRMTPKLLEENRVEEFGRLMFISHNGDRVTYHHNGKQTRYHYDVSDISLKSLVDDLYSQDPERVLRAQLYMQPGSYRCSTPQIDKMIDIVKEVPGCVGAQLGGAGLGGCIMILAREDATDTIIETLRSQYYTPLNIKALTHVCQPVEGSCMIVV